MALSVGGPQSRSSIPGVSQSFVPEYGQFLEQKYGKNDGNCMEAAIINAIELVLGREHALQLRAYVDQYMPHLVKIKEISRVFQEAKVPAEAGKFHVTPEFSRNPFSVLCSATSGIFIVHLREVKVVEHVFAVDATRGLTSDNTEKYPMLSSENILRACGSPEAADLKIASVRRIVNQREAHKAGSSSK